MKTLFRGLAATVLLSHVLVNGLGCSSHDDDDHDHGTTPETKVPADVVYQGGTTDEALASVIGVAAKSNDAKAGKVSAPADMSAVPGTPAFTFTWNAGTASASPPRAQAPRRLAELRRAVGAERAAHAHGTPFTGVAYYLVFSTPTKPRLAAVLTGTTSYQPDAETWNRMVAAKEVITITMITTRLENNALATDGGPWAPAANPSFTITP